MTTTIQKPKCILKLPVVMKRTGKSRAAIYEDKYLSSKRIKLGARSVGWLESDIDAWIDSRIAASRQAA